MDIKVALNGSKRRDLQLYAGDETTFVLSVYTLDGDTVPVAVTDARISTYWPSTSTTFPVGTQFTVPDDCCGRVQYRLVGEIGGVTTTLAYGTMTILGADCSAWRYDYGGPYGWGWP